MTTPALGPAPRRARTVGRGLRYHGPQDPSSIYRLFDAVGELIYIGMSYDPDTRVRVQRTTQPWGREIVHVEVEWHPNRDAAQAAEEESIKALQPKYNVVHTPEHRTRSLAHVRRRRARAQQIAEGRTTGKRKTEDAEPSGAA